MILDRERARERAARLIGESPEGSAMEVYVKQGRSRTVSFSSGFDQASGGLSLLCQASVERGYAVRWGDDRESAAWSGTGWPTTAPSDLRFAAGGLRLPSGELVEALATDTAAPPMDLDRPLLAEGEARRLAESVTEEVTAELGSRPRILGRLEDGASEALLVSSEGVEAVHRARTTSLRVELWSGELREAAYVASTPTRPLAPRAVARRLVDLIMVRRRAKDARAGGATVLAAPEVMAALLAGVAPALIRPRPEATVAGEEVTVVDDPSFPGGAFGGTTDGEGVPTRRTVLVERGRSRHWLRPWDTPSQRNEDWGNDDGAAPATGCRHRHGWRDLPRVGISNLVLEPSHRAPADMLGALANGVYLIGSDPLPRSDREGALVIGILGFEIRRGRLSRPVKGHLRVRPERLLGAIHEVGRDLRFSVLRGSVGAPSTLLDDVELQPSTEADGGPRRKAQEPAASS